MEDNSIDQIFSDKLRDFEKIPNASVWDNLQERKRLKQRRKVVVWYSTVAAAILILLVSGMVVWKGIEKDNLALEVAKVTTAKDKASVKPKVFEFKEAITGKALLSSSGNLSDKAIEVKKKPVKSSMIFVKALRKSKASKLVAPVIDVQTEESTVVSLPKEQLVATELVANHENTIVVVVNIAEVEEIQANVKLPELQEPVLPKLFSNEKKKTKAGKLFQQLKNVKNGEKINWHEIGLHPENLLALVRPNRESAKNAK